MALVISCFTVPPSCICYMHFLNEKWERNSILPQLYNSWFRKLGEKACPVVILGKWPFGQIIALEAV